jgi:hypothetical protein
MDLGLMGEGGVDLTGLAQDKMQGHSRVVLNSRELVI